MNSNKKLQQIIKYDTKKLVTQFSFRLRLRGLAQMKRYTRNLKTRMLRLIQDFDSFSIFVAISSSLLAIYPWWDPPALQINPWRDPLVYKSHIPCNSLTNFPLQSSLNILTSTVYRTPCEHHSPECKHKSRNSQSTKLPHSLQVTLFQFSSTITK